MTKVSKLRNIINRALKETSSVGGGTTQGANVTGGDTGEQTFTPITVKKPKKKRVKTEDAPILAGGEVKDNYAVSHFGFTPAPSVPNRKSKAMDYKKMFEDEGDMPDSGKINTNDASTDEILTYLQAAKQQGKLSPDAQQVLLQWMNSPGASREEIIRVLRQLTGIYLNENYARFRSETKTRTKPEQIYKAVKEIKKKLLEVDRLLEYTSRLRTEISEGDSEFKYSTHTTRALENIQEMIKHTYIKAKKLK